MPSPWVIIGALVLVIGSYFYGHRTGVQVTKADWEAEKAEAAIEAGRVLAKANQEVRELEHLLANTQTKVERVYVDKIKVVEIEREQFIDIARTDGLFIDAACPDPSNAMPGIAASPGSDHGGTKARLSGETAEALIAIAADADEITHQLTACQEILRNERELQRSLESNP
jgi:DNA gyrase/topoisomerase IV subunit A